MRARLRRIAIGVLVAMVLLVGAGLLLNGFLRLRAVDPGPDPDRTLTLQVFPSTPDLAEAKKSLRGIKAVDVQSIGLRGDNLDEWRALVRVAFLVERVGE